MFSCGCDDRVCFGVDAAAHLVPFAARDSEMLSEAEAQIAAIFASARRTVVSRGNNGVVFDDYGAESFSQAGRTLGHRLCDIKIVVDFRYSFHSVTSPCNAKLPFSVGAS